MWSICIHGHKHMRAVCPSVWLGVFSRMKSMSSDICTDVHWNGKYSADWQHLTLISKWGAGPLHTFANKKTLTLTHIQITLCNTWFKFKASVGSVPPCFYTSSCFILFVVALSFRASLHQRFITRQNCCRDSCSGVNWSISARFKWADNVARN